MNAKDTSVLLALSDRLGSMFTDRLRERLLQEPVGQSLIEASASFTAAAEALIAGDRAEFLRLKTKALARLARSSRTTNRRSITSCGVSRRT